MITLNADADAAGRRLDAWLGETASTGLSRSQAQVLIRDGAVLVDGRAVKPSHKLLCGQVVSVEVPAPQPPLELAPQNIPLEILHEDADVIVVNKPAGLVVHPACGHADGTLVNALLFHCHDLAGIGGELRPGIVHRLDRDTSGALVAAKNASAASNLMRQFKNRHVAKEYLALVRGQPKPPSGRIETMIGRSTQDRKKMSVQSAHGRIAITEYETRESFVAASLLSVRIATGRTHQIRVHMAHLGHAVVGDADYGHRGRERDPLVDAAPRQMLHAWKLSFQHPRTGAPLTFTAPVPEDMAALLDALRRQALTGGN
ncbi:MAG: RluA family pseudouridine synthase [bacterium]